jgi:hypothetical protein
VLSIILVPITSEHLVSGSPLPSNQQVEQKGSQSVHLDISIYYKKLLSSRNLFEHTYQLVLSATRAYPITNTYMAAQESVSGALPVYYGQHMQDGSVVQGPGPSHQGSRDALLRLPIQAPHSVHLNPDITSPTSPIVPVDSLGINSGTPSTRRPKIVGGDQGRYLTYPEDDREYRYRSRRYDPYQSSGYRGPYIEEYSDDEDRPRAYRRPARRYSRPPLSHQNFHSRYSRDQDRGSMDSNRPSIDYEPDTPEKQRVHYYYDSEQEDTRRGGRHPYPDAGGRGPPRRPPSTDEVLRLPWTMWMNSSAKNRRSRPKPTPIPRLRPLSLSTDPPSDDGNHLGPILPVQSRILTIC